MKIYILILFSFFSSKDLHMVVIVAADLKYFTENKKKKWKRRKTKVKIFFFEISIKKNWKNTGSCRLYVGPEE